MMTNNYNYDRFGVGNHKRESFRMKGDKFFSKTFEKKEWAEKYLAAVKRNPCRSCYAKIEDNNNGTYTLNLYKVEYWNE